MPWQEDKSWKVMGLNPGEGKSFFSQKISVDVYLFFLMAVESAQNYVK